MFTSSASLNLLLHFYWNHAVIFVLHLVLLLFLSVFLYNCYHHLTRHQVDSCRYCSNYASWLYCVYIYRWLPNVKWASYFWNANARPGGSYTGYPFHFERSSFFYLLAVVVEKLDLALPRLCFVHSCSELTPAATLALPEVKPHPMTTHYEIACHKV